MSLGLKPYPAYKDSGVEWLGEVPEHWEVRRLKSICRLAYGDALAEGAREDGITPVFGSNGRVGYHSSANTSAPCIVIGRKGSFGKVNFSYQPVFAIDTTFFVDDRNSAANLRWLFYLLGLLRLDQVSRDSAVPGLAREDAYTRAIAAPTFEEQVANARYLDYMDRRIRRYIRAKQKLIKLLEEQKQAIIHEAVTGQIDVRTGKLYPAYKDSGVEWLGEVPEHWEVKKLKHLTKFTNGFAFKPSDWGDEGTPIIRIQNLNGSDEFNFTVREDIPEKLLIKPGDLLFSWSGNRGTSFGSFIWDRDFAGYLNQHIFKLHDYWLPRSYFAYLLRAVTRHVEQEQTHGIIGLVHVTKPQLGSVFVPVAPPDEQAAIAESVDGQSSRLEMLLRRAAHSIELIREYRTRLIADVVTGKLDVREAAASLPDEAEEPELLAEEGLLTDESEVDETVEDEAALEGVEA
jgi:type I restriction enzyme S subunit